MNPAIPIHLCTALIAGALGADPLSPEEALRSFELADDSLTIELVVAEPNVMDPIAMTFDADGKLYVLEMRGFQMGPDGVGLKGLGRVRLLEDRNHDGVFEHAVIFVQDLFHPTAIMAFDGGILVGCAPDLFFFKDVDGDGVTDIRTLLFTGFGDQNHERMLNSFQWGLDNWIHGCAGGNGGEIRPGDRPHAPAVSVNGRDFRFRRIAPAQTSDESRARQPSGLSDAGLSRPGLVQPGLVQPRLSNSPPPPSHQPWPRGEWQFEAVSGGGQYGLTADNWDNWFTCENAKHIMHVVLPGDYAYRGAAWSPPEILRNIPEHGPAARIFRISPLEEWRVVRTKQRAASSQASRFPPTELFPGGYFTAATGIFVYNETGLPQQYRGNTFVCDAANNLVHRDHLETDGLTFVARRLEHEKEFLASKDPWFRPTQCATGPDGALYVVDMYREVIETPNSIPPDILKTINLENGHDRGRIYRVRRKDASSLPAAPRLSQKTAAELVALLGSTNRWSRLTAQRLLVERQDASAVAALERMTEDRSNVLGRLHAMWTLDGINALKPALLRALLADPDPQLRAQALRIAEHRLQPGESLSESNRELLDAIKVCADDQDIRVRFQTALTAWKLPDDERPGLLARIMARDAGDARIRAAVLLSLDDATGAFWNLLANQTFFRENTPGSSRLTEELFTLMVLQGDSARLDTAVSSLAVPAHDDTSWWRAAALTGLRQGLQRGGAGRVKAPESLLSLIHADSPRVRNAARQAAGLLNWPASPQFEKAVTTSLEQLADAHTPVAEQIAILAFVARGGWERVAPHIDALLSPDQSIELQKAAVEALAHTRDPRAAPRLTALWSESTPGVQTTIIDVMLQHTQFVPPLLDTIGTGTIPAWSISATQRQRLLEHGDAAIRASAKKVLDTPTDQQRQSVYDTYVAALTSPGDTHAGRDVFRAQCAVCHVLEDFGSAVGPDLKGVKDREAAALLTDILLPSRAITPGYGQYLIDTLDDESLAGVVAREDGASITLRMREGQERTIQRDNIRSLQASRMSMMPDELETAIDRKQMADLIAYLKSQPAK